MMCSQFLPKRILAELVIAIIQDILWYLNPSLTVSLFPELGGHLDAQLSIASIRVHSTHGGRVGTGEIIKVPPAETQV